MDVVERQWGYYKVLHEGDGYSVKELTILPGKSLSDQRHFKRGEHWLVVKGKLFVAISDQSEMNSFIAIREAQFANNSLFIPIETWHRPYNDGTEPVVVIETWLGDSTEEDIEKRNV